MHVVTVDSGTSVVLFYKKEEIKNMGKYNERHKEYTSKYIADNYDTLKVRCKKGYKEEIKAAADQAGESVNAYIMEAVKKRMEEEQ